MRKKVRRCHRSELAINESMYDNNDKDNNILCEMMSDVEE